METTDLNLFKKYIEHNRAEQARRARIARLREVAEGRWRNPGATPEARAINSRPHKHTGDLAAAIEKLKHGAVADLTPAELEAHRAYRRRLRAALAERMTNEQRQRRREQWRQAWRRRHPKK